MSQSNNKSQNTSQNNRGPHAQRVHEKPKDFGRSFSRMIKQNRGNKLLLVVAIFFAIISSAITIYSPKKLSELTDIVTQSIKVDTANIEDLTRNIYRNMQENPGSDLLYEGKTISSDDQLIYMQVMESIQENLEPSSEISPEKQNKMLENYLKLPQSIIEIIEPKTDLDTIWKIGITLLILYSVSSIFSYIQSFILADYTNNYARDLRKVVGDKINKLPLNYFDTHQVGDIISRITNDVDTIAMSLNQSLGSLASSTTLLIGSVLMMFITNWILALVAIGSSLLGFVFIGLILSNSQKYFKARQVALGSLNGHIEEAFSALNIIKAYNGVKQSYDKFSVLNKELYNANLKSKFISSLMHPIMMFVGNLGYVAVSIVGAILTANGTITFGVIVAFMTYVRLFTNPLIQITQSMTSLQSSVAASERVFEFLDEDELSDESEINFRLDPNYVQGKIEFKDIVFQYPSNEKSTIKGFSATALPGQKIAIVGPTGAGKSTIVNLLMKFYEIKEGDILIDGHSIHNLSRENIHELFTMILQDTWLFNGTIRENIVYNMENVSDEELHTLTKYIGIDHFIRTLPDKFDTIIEDNDSVSAGQRQLLTIARGMLKNAPFLILDEATSNVDTRTEETIQEAMDKLMVGRTSFIIAHRLSTIVNADTILVMNDGNIIEQGNHKQLLAENGFYAELYNSQFSL